MGAAGYPHLRDDTAFVARATVEALITLDRRVHVRDRGLADAAAEHKLLHRDIVIARRRIGCHWRHRETR